MCARVRNYGSVALRLNHIMSKKMSRYRTCSTPAIQYQGAPVNESKSLISTSSWMFCVWMAFDIINGTLSKLIKSIRIYLTAETSWCTLSAPLRACCSAHLIGVSTKSPATRLIMGILAMEWTSVNTAWLARCTTSTFLLERETNTVLRF